MPARTRQHEHDDLGHVLGAHHPGQRVRGAARVPPRARSRWRRRRGRRSSPGRPARAARGRATGRSRPGRTSRRSRPSRSAARGGPASEASTTTSAASLSSRCGSAARTAQIVPFRLTSIISSTYSGVRSRNEPYAPTPALATRMSSRPNRSTVAAASDSSCAEVADVARLGDRVEPEVVAAARREPEPDALLGERAGDGGADPAARAGDEGDLSFQCAHASSSGLSAGYRSRKRSYPAA